MSDAAALIQHIVGEDCPDAEAAIGLLDDALEREVDPLDYCAASLGMGEDLVMRRAAAWVDMPYSPTIPFEDDHRIVPDRLEAVPGVKVLSVVAQGRRPVYIAPKFIDVLRLARQRPADGQPLTHGNGGGAAGLSEPRRLRGVD